MKLLYLYYCQVGLTTAQIKNHARCLDISGAQNGFDVGIRPGGWRAQNGGGVGMKSDGWRAQNGGDVGGRTENWRVRAPYSERHLSLYSSHQNGSLPPAPPVHLNNGN